MALPQRRRGPREKPITPRFALLCCCLASTAAASTGASPPLPLDEETFVARYQERIGVDEIASARAQAALAEARARLPWSNPVLGYQREQTFGLAAGGGGAEDFVTLQQEVDLSGRRGLLEEAGERRAQAEERLGRVRRAQARADAQRLFYGLGLLEQRSELRRGWSESLAKLAAVLRDRQRAGDVARYDLLRVEREESEANALLQLDGADLAAARARVSSILGSELGSVVVELLPPERSDTEAVARQDPAREEAADADVPAIALTKLRAEAFAHEADAARRWYLPPLTVGAGGKTLVGPSGVEPGYLVTLSVPLPLWTRGDNEALAADQNARALFAEAEGERALWLQRERGLRERARRLVEVGRVARGEPREKARAVADTAQAAYLGGEVSILELLDAERGRLSSELFALERAAEARDALIALEAHQQGARP